MSNTSGNTITQNFNPFIASGGAYLLGATSFIYEPLIQFDLAHPPKDYPWLATGYKWSHDGKVITFTIRKGVKWSNGTPMTPADVAFTYQMVQKNPGINSGGLKILGVSTAGDTVTLRFGTPQYTNIFNVASVPIVPKAVWSKVSNPVTYADADPVGTGPYKFTSFSSQGISMSANSEYWQQGEPKVSKVFFQVYLGSNAGADAIERNQLDWLGGGIPNGNKVYVKPDPSQHKYWMGAASSVAMFPNLTKWPTNQLPVRQAISDAISRSTLSVEGETDYELPLTNRSGLTLPTFKPYLSPSVSSMSLSGAANPSEAKSILQKAGYVMGKDGYFHTKSGKLLAVTVTAPSVFTDYSTDGTIEQQELRKAGIDATFTGQGEAVWASDIASGNFELTQHWGNNGPTPYSLYDGWLDSSLATKAASGDFERLRSRAMDADLAKLAAAPSLSKEVTALGPIEKYVATQLPVIPLLTAANWDTYNTSHFAGWPTAANPYMAGNPGVPGNEVVALHLHPAG